jgi:hypothetical protein
MNLCSISPVRLDLRPLPSGIRPPFFQPIPAYSTGHHSGPFSVFRRASVVSASCVATRTHSTSVVPDRARSWMGRRSTTGAGGVAPTVHDTFIGCSAFDVRCSAFGVPGLRGTNLCLFTFHLILYLSAGL